MNNKKLFRKRVEMGGWLRLFYIYTFFITFSFIGVNPLFAQLSFRNYKEFPAFKLKASDGSIFSTTKVLKEKSPTVIVYFSPTCQHCQSQTVDITSNIKLFKDAQFLFVTSFPAADTRPFLDGYAIEKFQNIVFGYDTAFVMGKFFDLKTLPGIYIYDASGKMKQFFETNVKPQILYSAIFEDRKM